MNLNPRNIVGAILLISGVVGSFVVMIKGVTNWYELVIPLATMFLSLFAFDFITIKAIKETLEVAKKKKEDGQ